MLSNIALFPPDKNVYACSILYAKKFGTKRKHLKGICTNSKVLTFCQHDEKPMNVYIYCKNNN